MSEREMPRCFIAMPIGLERSEAERYGDPQHWEHVIEYLFKPAITLAGYEPVVPTTRGSHLIHEVIVRELSECELVLCDLSGHNPNVFFELGVRTALNLPIALVHDGEDDLPFDTSGINTPGYRPALHGWELEEDREALRQHILDAASSCISANPMWRKFGLEIKAHEPHSDETPLAAKLDILLAKLEEQERRPRGLSFDSWVSLANSEPTGVARPLLRDALSRQERVDELRNMIRMAQQAHGVKLDLVIPIEEHDNELVVLSAAPLRSDLRRELARSATNRGFSLSFIGADEQTN